VSEIFALGKFEMKRYIKVLAVVALISVAVVSGRTLYKQEQPVQNKTQKNADDDLPIASYDAVEITGSKERVLRKLRGKHYDSWGVINETTRKGGMIIYSEVEYPALPVGQSDLILIGEVVEAQAYLSNNKSGVYSEFTTRVNEIIKQDNNTFLASDSLITTERAGGRVKFPSGGVVKFRFLGQGMPRQGRQYLFFLKHNEERENYTILTAYELRAGKVFPIDGTVAAIGNKVWPFDTYHGADKSLLINDLQNEIAHPSQKMLTY
jgi:hypothetical protein